MEEKTQRTLIISGTILVIAVIAVLVFFNTVSGSTLTANGQATVKAIPDRVGIYLYINTEAKTAEEAKNLNSEIYDKVLTELVKLGLERKDIATQSYSVNPKYDWSNGKSTQDGYQAMHYIKIDISSDDSDLIGKIIDKSVESGALVSYINFELSQEKQNEYKAEALKAATEDARAKAEGIASGLGQTVGKVVSVSTSDFGYYPWRAYGEVASVSGVEDAKQAFTNIQPGEQEVSGSVSVVFKIR